MAQAQDQKPIFSKAVRSVTFGKIGLYGGTGSGKTTTAAKIAIGISKTMCNSAPVYMADTEKGSDFIEPLFQKEGVEFQTVKTRSFAVLKDSVGEAQRAGAGVLIVDSMTHFWVELVRSFCSKRKIEKPEFQHWKVIKDEWAEFTTRFINSRIHVICCGRAGSEYDYQENEDGKKELVKGDTKMKAEGEFGYETDLLIELVSSAGQIKADGAKTRKSSSKGAPSIVTHFAIVKKSRVWALNGKVFQFPDKDIYVPGDWKTELTAFAPFFDFLKGGATHVGVDNRDSTGLFNGNGQTEYYEKKRKIEVCLEEIKGALQAVWSASTGKDAVAKSEVLMAIFETRSWTAVEGMGLPALAYGARVTKKMVQLTQVKGSVPATLPDILDLIKSARVEIAAEDASPSLEEEQAKAATTGGDDGFFSNQ